MTKIKELLMKINTNLKLRKIRKTSTLTIKGRYYYEYLEKISKNEWTQTDYVFSYEEAFNEFLEIMRKVESFAILPIEEQRRLGAFLYIDIYRPVYEKQFGKQD